MTRRGRHRATALACHGTDTVLAVGNASGQVLVYRIGAGGEIGFEKQEQAMQLP